MAYTTKVLYLKNQSLELESVHIHSHKHESKQISDIIESEIFN